MVERDARRSWKREEKKESTTGTESKLQSSGPPLSGRTIVGTKTRRPRDRRISVRCGNNEKRRGGEERERERDRSLPTIHRSMYPFVPFFFPSLPLVSCGSRRSRSAAQSGWSNKAGNSTPSPWEKKIFIFYHCNFHSEPLRFAKSRLPLRFRVFPDFTPPLARKRSSKAKRDGKHFLVQYIYIIYLVIKIFVPLEIFKQLSRLKFRFQRTYYLHHIVRTTCVPYQSTFRI